MTCLPAVELLAWYTAIAPVDRHLSFYASVRDKALAVAEPFQFFLRLDPFPSTVPTTSSRSSSCSSSPGWWSTASGRVGRISPTPSY